MLRSLLPCFATVSLLTLGFLAAPHSHAATLFFVGQNTGNGGAANNYGWNDAGGENVWATSPGGTGTQSTTQSGNDYIVDGDDSTATLRANDATFNGDSLTVQDGGLMRFDGNAVRTVNLIYNNNGGSGDQLVGGNNVGLAGSLDVVGNGATFNLGSTTGFTISSAMSGAGNLRFRTTNNNTSEVGFSSNATDGFTGVLTVGQTSINRADIDLSFDYDINTPGFTLSLIDGETTGNAQLNLDRTLAFQDVFVGGTSNSGSIDDGTADGIELADGSYSWADLDAAGYGSYFIDNGGTLLVAVPEPSSVSLLGAGLLFASFFHRRRRSA